MFQLVENRDSSSQLLASDCDFVTFLVHSECPLLGHQEQYVWTLVRQAAGVSSHMYVCPSILHLSLGTILRLSLPGLMEALILVFSLHGSHFNF